MEGSVVRQLRYPRCYGDAKWVETKDSQWKSRRYEPFSLVRITRNKIIDELLYKEGIEQLGIPSVLKIDLRANYFKEKLNSEHFKIDKNIKEAVAHITWEEPFLYVDDDCILHITCSRWVDLELPEGQKLIICERYYRITRHLQYKKKVCFDCAHSSFPEKDYCMIHLVTEEFTEQREQTIEYITSKSNYCWLCERRTLFSVESYYERDPVFRPWSTYPEGPVLELQWCGENFFY